MYKRAKDKEQRLTVDQSRYNQDTLLNIEGNNLIVNEDTLVAICNVIAGFYSRNVTVQEVSRLSHFLTNYPANNLRRLSADQAINRLAEDFLRTEIMANTPSQDKDREIVNSYQKEVLGRPEDNDYYTLNGIHEMSVKNANTPEVTDINRLINYMENRLSGIGPPPDKQVTPDRLSTILKQSYKDYSTYDNINLNHHELNLDSRNRLLLEITDPNANSDPVFAYSWNINYSNSVGRQGSLRVPYVLENIVQLRTREFWFPLRLVANRDNLLFYKKLRIFIEQFSGQSVQTDMFAFASSPGRNLYFHFEFEITNVVNDMAKCVPTVGSFETIYPIKNIEHITIQFMDPYNPIELLPDRGIYQIAPAPVPPAPPTPYTRLTLLSASDSGLQPGDLVYLNVPLPLAATPAVAALWRDFTRSTGFLVTYVSGTLIEITFGSATGAALLTALGTTPIELYYSNRRINFQIRAISFKEI